MDGDLWSWLIIAEMVLVEFPLFVVDFSAVTDLFYVSTLVLLIWRIVALVIDGIAWGALVYFADRETNGPTTMRTRGNSWMRSQIGFFIIPLLIHAVMIVALIIHRAKFGGLAPLSFTVNFPAFEVQRSVQLLGAALFAAVVVPYWYNDGKHRRVHQRISILLSKTAAPGSQQ